MFSLLLQEEGSSPISHGVSVQSPGRLKAKGLVKQATVRAASAAPEALMDVYHISTPPLNLHVPHPQPAISLICVAYQAR